MPSVPAASPRAADGLPRGRNRPGVANETTGRRPRTAIGRQAAAAGAALLLALRAPAFAALLAAAPAALLVAAPAAAKDAAPEAADPALEARLTRVASELRCLVCQNQTIADSHADLAVDLRRQVREQLRAGRSDAEIIDYMTARYGDFVLYRPPFKATTALLWLGPASMLAGGVAVLVVVLRRRGRLPAEAFEADDEDDAAPVDPPIARSPSVPSTAALPTIAATAAPTDVRGA